jgi:hypothetical protein
MDAQRMAWDDDARVLVGDGRPLVAQDHTPPETSTQAAVAQI